MKRYYIKLNNYNLNYINHLNISKINKGEKTTTFYVNKKGYLELLNLGIIIEAKDILKDKLIFLFRKKLITIIGFLLMLLLIVNQSKAIVNIKFIEENKYDEDVVIFLDKYYTKIGPFLYLNKSLSNINQDLRTEFFNYEWISVIKKGSYLYIDIKKLHVKHVYDDNDNLVGDLVANKEGIVKFFYAQKGVVLVVENMSVSKGDILISGNLRIHNEEIDYIKPIGYVIAEVIEYKTFNISKEEILTIKSGKIAESNNIILFNKKILSIGQHSTFSDYSTEEENKFNLFNLFKINNATYYEEKVIINHYTLEEAISYSKTLIESEFNSNKTNDNEKIIFIELLKVIEGNENYIISFIIKKRENIAIFHQYSPS